MKAEVWKDPIFGLEISLRGLFMSRAKSMEVPNHQTLEIYWLLQHSNRFSPPTTLQPPPPPAPRGLMSRQRSNIFYTCDKMSQPSGSNLIFFCKNGVFHKLWSQLGLVWQDSSSPAWEQWWRKNAVYSYLRRIFSAKLNFHCIIYIFINQRGPS